MLAVEHLQILLLPFYKSAFIAMNGVGVAVALLNSISVTDSGGDGSLAYNLSLIHI